MKWTKKRRKKVQKLLLTGLTYQQVGDALGVSRQRIFQVVRDYNLIKPGELNGIRQRLRTTQENKLRQLLGSAKGKCKRKGIVFDITPADIETPEFCPVFGLRLKYELKTPRQENSASIDRHIPSLGYVPGNVFVISWRANRLKNDSSVEDLQKLLDYMKKS